MECLPQKTYVHRKFILLRHGGTTGNKKIGKGLPTETISLPWRVLNGMGDVLNNASDVRTWAYCIGWLAVWTFKRYKKGRKG